MSEYQDFLSDFVRLNQGTEVPEEFALWCGLAGISTVLGRRCWIDLGPFVLYPNMYIVLVAGSGRCRKSTSIKQIEKLLRSVEPLPNIVAQKITPEGLIDAIKGKSEKDPKKPFAPEVTADCVGFILVDELATFLNKKSYEAGLGSLLCSFFDCHSFWSYQTKSRGEEKLTNMCLGILGGATVDWIRDGVPPEAIGGGLTSRIVFVYVDKTPKPVAFPFYGDDKKKLFEKLVRDLQQISTYEGEYKLTQEAVDYVTLKYEDFVTNHPFYLDKTLQGYASRRQVHWLKLSLIVTASRSNTHEIGLDAVMTAEALLVQCEQNMPKVLNMITSTGTGEQNSMILNLIERMSGGGGITRTELLRLVSNQVSSVEFQTVIQTLRDSGQIHEIMVNGKEIRYVVVK